MVMLEAAGLRLYQDLAGGKDGKDVHVLLLHNGREELPHAHRVAKAIGESTGTDYPVPEPDDNPYLVGPEPRPKPVTVEILQLSPKQNSTAKIHTSAGRRTAGTHRLPACSG